MKYCQEIVEEICKYIRIGNTYEDSAILAGISKATYYRWQDDNDTTLSKDEKQDFRDAIKKAELQCKSQDIAIIKKAALTIWQAAAWRLERRYRDEYGKYKQIKHTGEMKHKIEISQERKEKILKELGLFGKEK